MYSKSAFRLMVFCGFMALSQFASATSGKVDANGCHNSKKAGWHCHSERAGQYKELPASHETANQRDKRMARECKNMPNAGACLGYGR